MLKQVQHDGWRKLQDRAPAHVLILALSFILAACDPAPEPVPEQAQGAEHIACAIAGAKEFKPACAVERAPAGETLFLVVRHPDGGFRRFEVLADGRGLAAADGADAAQVALRDGGIEVTVDKDRYRFPATVKPHD